MTKKFGKPKKHSKLNYLLHAVGTVDLSIKISFIIALLSILNYECKIITLVWVNDFTKGINTVLVQIFYAYITGYIFYFIIQYSREHKKKTAIFFTLSNNGYFINQYSRGIIEMLCKLEYGENETTIKEADFKNLCGKFNIHSTIVKAWYTQSCNLKEFVLLSCKTIETNSREILQFSDVIDIEWIERIDIINTLLKQIQQLIELNDKTSSLNLVSHQIWQLYFEIEGLQKINSAYNNKFYSNHIAKYRLKYPLRPTWEFHYKA